MRIFFRDGVEGLFDRRVIEDRKIQVQLLRCPAKLRDRDEAALCGDPASPEVEDVEKGFSGSHEDRKPRAVVVHLREVEERGEPWRRRHAHEVDVSGSQPCDERFSGSGDEGEIPSLALRDGSQEVHEESLVVSPAVTEEERLEFDHSVDDGAGSGEGPFREEDERRGREKKGKKRAETCRCAASHSFPEAVGAPDGYVGNSRHRSRQCLETPENVLFRNGRGITDTLSCTERQRHYAPKFQRVQEFLFASRCFFYNRSRFSKKS